MMERALEYQKPLECTLRMESNLIGWILTPEQWKMVSNMIYFLQPFKDMTELMSKQDFPTISFYSLVYSKIFSQYGVDAKRKLKAIDPKTGRTFPTWLRNAAKEANDKLERYYPSSKGLMYIAGTVLDPRLTLQSIGSPSTLVSRRTTQNRLKNSRTTICFCNFRRQNINDNEITRYLSQPTRNGKPERTGQWCIRMVEEPRIRLPNTLKNGEGLSDGGRCRSPCGAFIFLRINAINSKKAKNVAVNNPRVYLYEGLDKGKLSRTF
ncbi:uncharacterized protein LOC118433049 [Folsomia candida]|uniref:uncharacterized protein LOC118433049 n=1 Tax=Folsomia candida TaxID=158441 RepID=UPI001604A5F7|nr:uncharacterized protein LOC118433049 [Folsomia candida]